MLALGSPTYPLPDDSYPAWLSTYVWTKIYDYEFVYAGPLFIHRTAGLVRLQGDIQPDIPRWVGYGAMLRYRL